MVIDFTYPVSMRAAPTVAFSTIVYGNMSGLSLATAQPDHARIIAVVGDANYLGMACARHLRGAGSRSGRPAFAAQ